MSLRIILLGTGEFALPPFRALLESEKHQVVGVCTQPDRTGRGHHRHVNKVKVLAEEFGRPVFQPERVNTSESLNILRELNADLFVVAAYGQIMKPEFLAIPRLGAFNLHGSLLPRHRGAAPVQYAIWKGDAETGVTMFQIEPALDSGPMVGKIRTNIQPGETSGQLMLRLADMSAELTLSVVDQLNLATAVFEPQDPSQVTLSPKIRKEQGIVDWAQTASQVECHVRAMQPWPKAVTWLHSTGREPSRCILQQVEVTVAASASASRPGRIGMRDRKMVVSCGSGNVDVLKIQPEGKAAMDARDFANGYGISDDAHFGPLG
ncbi:MAG TPA: methionyl-tRNA formyltransferase [Planctomycetes bacterium]|nr:methionyl-tRNA formyltransferase [Fuerstiella sp.]HIK95433.1 methionyl-tRNA formyltransferase [Planctomycetota bacterium]